MEPVYQNNQHPTLMMISSARNCTSPKRLDELSSDRDDAIFPETEMQLEMIMRKASETSRKAGDASPQVIMDQSKLIILEDSFTVIKKRNDVLITENESLRSQLRTALNKIREVENKKSNLSRKLEGSDSEGQKKKVEDRGVSTTDFLETMERGIQVGMVCRACERKFEDRKSVEATVIMTKSELDRMEEDMRRLRDAVATREFDWERAVERENSYREQLKRLAAESITSRQLSDSRHTELERLAQTLVEAERNLRSAQREISALKKIIVRQERRQRELEGNETNRAQTGPEVNEKEPKWIDDMVKQLSKNKQKSKLPKDKAIYTSGTNSSSNQSSPRSQATGKSIDEPVTVTEILSKL